MSEAVVVPNPTQHRCHVVERASLRVMKIVKIVPINQMGNRFLMWGCAYLFWRRSRSHVNITHIPRGSLWYTYTTYCWYTLRSGYVQCDAPQLSKKSRLMFIFFLSCFVCDVLFSSNSNFIHWVRASYSDLLGYRITAVVHFNSHLMCAFFHSHLVSLHENLIVHLFIKIIFKRPKHFSRVFLVRVLPVAAFAPLVSARLAVLKAEQKECVATRIAHLVILLEEGKKQLMVKCCVFSEYLQNMMCTYIRHCGCGCAQLLDSIRFCSPKSQADRHKSTIVYVEEVARTKSKPHVLHDVYRFFFSSISIASISIAQFNMAEFCGCTISFWSTLITCDAGIQLIKIGVGMAN